MAKRKSTAEKLVKKGEEKVESAVVNDNQNFEECINIIAKTKEGLYVLNRLMERSGFLISSVKGLKDGSTDEGAIQFNEGRRSVYLNEIRRFLSNANLKKIEFFDRSVLCKRKRTIQEKT